MAGLLTRDAILAAPDLKTEDVDVPEWGGTVRLAVLTGDAKAAWEKSCQVRKKGPRGEISIEPNDKVNVRASLAAKVMVDEQGEPLFSEADVAALGRKSAAALERVFDAACRMNHIGEKDAAELEGEEKNS